MKLHFIHKLILFILLTAVTQIAITIKFPQLNSNTPLDTIQKVNNSKNAIYFFGDSSVNFADDKDQDKHSIPQLIKPTNSNLKVINLAHPSQNPQLYHSYTKFFINNKRLPKLAIYPINLRAFSIQWDQKPAYQFPTKHFLAKYHNHILAKSLINPAKTLNFFNTQKRIADYNSTPIYLQGELLGTVKNIQKPTSPVSLQQYQKNMLAMFYLYQLTPNHPALIALENTAKLLQTHNIPTIFYFTPIDYLSGNKSHGEIFAQITNQNKQLITATLSTYSNISIIDISEDLESPYFRWTKTPNEHLSDSGRIHIANLLNQQMSLLLDSQ